MLTGIIYQIGSRAFRLNLNWYLLESLCINIVWLAQGRNFVWANAVTIRNT